eukprot:583845-Pelagomonas_calceolata.AAC.1
MGTGCCKSYSLTAFMSVSPDVHEVKSAVHVDKCACICANKVRLVRLYSTWAFWAPNLCRGEGGLYIEMLRDRSFEGRAYLLTHPGNKAGAHGAAIRSLRSLCKRSRNR